MPVLGNTTHVHQPDEDYINKSLLASLDAQADAEPLDDAEHPDRTDKPAPPFQPRRPPRPDSPSDALYPIHHAHPGLFEYPNEYDAPRYNPKPNGFPASNYRASFTSFPNTTRNRLGHQTSQSALNSAAPPFRDTPAFFPPADAFAAAQMTSPGQTHMQPFDHRPSYDFSQPNGSHKPYLPDQYPPAPLHNPAKPAPQQQPPHSGFPSSHPYSNGVQLSSQTPYGPHVPAMSNPANPAVPPGLSNSSSMNMPNGSNTTANGEEISTIFVVGFPDDMQEREFQNMFTFSQGFEAATLKIPNKEYTAYGSLAGPNTNALRGPGAFQYSGPNDPYNLVTVNQGGVVIDGGRDGPISSWPAQHPQLLDDLNTGHFLGGPGSAGLGMGMGSNNPNLPPRKQIIGFAKFRTREEALAARDALQGRRVDIEKGAVLKAEMAKKNLHTKRGVGPIPGVPGMGSANQSQQQQQQQHANGMSADAFNMDPSFPPAAPPSNRDSMQSLSRLGGWRESFAGPQQQHPNSQAPIPTDASVPVNGTREDEDRKRESVLSLGLGIAGLSLGPGGVSPSMTSAQSVAIPGPAPRGTRERAEEEEREREARRRKEAKESAEREKHLMRLRASNAAAFDAFHSVPAAQPSTSPNANGMGSAPISRQSSNASATSVSGVSPWASTSTAPTAESAAATSPTLDEPEVVQKPLDLGEAGEQHDEAELQSPPGENGIVGPWDRINNVNLRSAVLNISESERSSSPVGIDAQPQQLQRQSATYQPQFLHLHEQQQQAAQAQQQLYHSSSQSESSETGSAVGVSDVSSGMAPGSGQAAQNPIGYVGARLGFGAPGQGQAPAQGAMTSFVGQSTFPRGAAAPFVPLNGVLNNQQPIGGGPLPSLASQRAPNAISTAASTTGAPSSGSSAAGSVSGGNTSPQLPSPASASGTGSTTSITSVTSGANGIGGGSSVVRGTVDQNPPINTLYVGNLPTSPPPIGYPTDYLEEILRDVFSSRPGYRKLCYRHKANGPMCFVEFESVEYAAKALQEMSGHTLRGAVKNGIRLSYSKNPLGVRTPTSAGANQGGPTLQQQQQLTQSLNNHHFQQQYHHQQQHQHHQQGQGQGQQGSLPPPPTSASSSGDEFHAPMGHRGILPSSILRRDSVLSPTSPTSLAQAQGQAAQFMSSSGGASGNTSGGGGNNNNNNNSGNNNPNSFLSSPPPRFYSTSPGSGMAFGTASTGTPLTGASSAFVPRSAMNVNVNVNGAGGPGAGGAGAGGMFNGGGFGAFAPFAVPPHYNNSNPSNLNSNEIPFGQPPGALPPPSHMHAQAQLPSIPNNEQQQQQQLQGGPADES